MMSRRMMLRGGASVVALGWTAGVALSFERTTPSALRPWVAPGALAADPRVRAVEWAVLVPNPHNRQPWRVRLVDDAEVLVHCDLDRRLPHTDPFDRQIVLGLGCFVEMFVLAAGAAGYGVAVTPFPDGAPGETERLDGRPVAHLRLLPGEGALDPLFASAPFRRTNKAPYDGRRPDAAALAAVAAAPRATRAAFSTEAGAVERLTAIAFRAGETEFLTERTRRESIDLMRIGRAEIDANPDGIDLGGPMIEDLHAKGVLTRQTMMDPTAPAFAQAGEMYAAGLRGTHTWLHQVSPGNGRADQLAAGRDWLRIALAATAAGIDLHPYSQALQEFAEVAPMAAELSAELGVAAPERVQMLARVGYGPATEPSPRWPATSVII